MLKRAMQVLMAIAMSATLGLAALPQEARADVPTPTPSASPTPTPTPVTPKPVAPAKAVTPTVYNQPGDHYVNGRFWKTECSMYSTHVVRCTTDIWATKVIQYKGTYYNHNGWVFNNLTYLPSGESQWTGNRLAYTNEWTATDGRKWKTE